MSTRMLSIMVLFSGVFCNCGSEPNRLASGNTPQEQKPESGQSDTLPHQHAPSITYQIIPGEKNTYGYDIYMDGSLMIHQPARPALPGNKGFATKENAEKAAQLVVKKISENQMPPTISQEEMKDLGESL